MDDTKLIRFCALWHDGVGLARTKVLFRDEEGKEYGYWMDRDVYDKIPLGVEASLADYKKHGTVDEALDTDIYSNK